MRVPLSEGHRAIAECQCSAPSGPGCAQREATGAREVRAPTQLKGGSLSGVQLRRYLLHEQSYYSVHRVRHAHAIRLGVLLRARPAHASKRIDSETCSMQHAACNAESEIYNMHPTTDDGEHARCNPHQCCNAQQAAWNVQLAI